MQSACQKLSQMENCLQYRGLGLFPESFSTRRGRLQGRVLTICGTPGDQMGQLRRQGGGAGGPAMGPEIRIDYLNGFFGGAVATIPAAPAGHP